MDTNGWSRAELHVMKELERLADEIGGLRQDMTEAFADLRMLKAGLKAHAAIFGLLGGATVTVVTGVFFLVLH